MLDPRTRKRQRRRRQRIKQNQLKISFNWFLAFIVMLLWLCLGFIVIYVEPSLLKDIPFVGWYGPFFLVVFLTLLATIRFLSGNRKRALLIAGLITLFLMLRIHQLGQWHNLII